MTRSHVSERLSRAASAAVEILENRCLLSALTPNSSVLVFNDDLTSGQPSHTDVLTLTNTGSSTLTLGGWSITADPSDATNQSADFHVISGALPSSLAAGASTQVSLDFTATVANSVESALLNISSSDPSSPTTIQLHGLGTDGSYGYNEPSLANILTAFDIPTNIGVTNPSNSQYPEDPSSSSQEVPMQRLVAAGTGPVTITPLASFNSSVATTVRFGYYTPGDPTDTTELFTIGQPDAQTVNPTALGATSFNPGTSPFSLYAVFPGTSTPNGSTDVHYSEDALNTLDPSDPEKFRFFPLETANGTIVPNTYIVAAEDYNSTTYNSFTNFVGIISNVKPASDATNAAVLGLTNLSGVPSTTQLVFNRIQNPNPADPAGFTDIVHDTNTLQINNTGDQTLVISSMTLSDTTNWQIVNPPSYPLDIAPGGTADVTIKFIAQTDPPHTNNQTNDTVTTNGLTPQQAGGVWDGTLTLNSNDPVNPARTVQLAGYWQDMSENENEPGLQTIINSLFGYGTDISNTQQPEYPNNSSQAVLYGEEVASGLWESADPSLPVSVLQLDAFHNQFSDGTEPATLTGWYAAGNSSNPTWLFQQQPGESQSLLPTIKGSSTEPAEGSFSPTGEFGFDLDGELSQDSLNTTDISLGRSGHAVRFYPVRTATGALVPNEWLMVMDYENSQYDNSDFQDNVYLVTNMHPATQAPAPQDAQATAGAAGILLQWQPVSDSILQGYNVYRSSSINGTYTKLNSSPISTASYVDTTAAAGVTSYYRITAVDSSGESEAANAWAAALASNATTTTLAATADAYVLDGSPNSNFGTATDLQVKESNAGYNHETYITFNLASISGSVTGATLNLYGDLETAGAGYTVDVLPTTGTWTQSTLTWNTKPTDGTTVLATATVSGTTGAWYSFNLTSYIQAQLAAGNTTLSLAIAGSAYTSGGYADFNSTNASSNTPQLVVTSAPTATAPPTPSSLSVTGTTSSSVSLSWAASTGATSYAVLRKGPTDSGYTSIATPTSTSYTDTSVSANSTYSYEVEAVASGLASSPTSPVSATTGAGATATFVKSDSSTEGNWTGVYGSDGYDVFDGPSSVPSYAQVSASGENAYVWQSPTTDARAPQNSAGSSARAASCFYSPGGVGTSFTINVNLTDGNSHQVALYLLDWDSRGRAETVQVTDANSGAVLSTQSVSNFTNGTYLIWDLTGSVKITITCTAGVNAVASGLFFSPVPTTTTKSATASFIKADTTTGGTWTGVYGSDGYSIFNGAQSIPSYAQVTPINDLNYTWANPTSSTQALQNGPSNSSRIAACDFSSGGVGSSFGFNLNLTDGNVHQVALYLLDWDARGRAETVQITDANTGAVLSTQSASNFTNGEYLVWNLSGDVNITITCTGGLNAVASGLFFGSAPTAPQGATASFVKSDTTTAGTWTGVYGADGYSVFDGATSLPSYVQVAAVNDLNYTWASPTSSTQALQNGPSSSSRIAACDYTSGGVGSSFSLDVDLTDGQTHQVALYLLDWDARSRAESIQITDATSGAVLSTQSVSNFTNGEWLVWNITGNVKITITCTGGLNAVASGLFFGA